MEPRAHVVEGGPASIDAATVLRANGARVDVQGPSFGVASARLAVPAYVPRAGDSVLVAANASGLFVIGVLRALREPEQVLVAPDGSSAEIATASDGTVEWRLRDPHGALVFERRGATTVLHAPDDLELTANGDLALRAKGRVRIESDEGAALIANGPIALRSEEASELVLDGERVRVVGERIEGKAERADLRARELNVAANTVRVVADRIREQAESVERKAGRVIEHAREIYREVEELSQTRAGRLRLVARTALYALGKTALIQAEDDVKVKGERIHLG